MISVSQSVNQLIGEPPGIQSLEPVITALDLKPLLEQKNPRTRPLLVDARPFHDYVAGHIPGAVNIDLMQFHWLDTSKKGIKDFNRQSRLLLSNIGVTQGRLVVFYESISGPSAARGVWLLSYFSHRKVAMLDGGFEKWKSLKFPVETRTNQFVHSEFKGRIDPRVMATVTEVKSFVSSKRGILIDSRSIEEYTGKVSRAAMVGHIPGAINIDWNDNIRDGVFKSRKELQQLYPFPKDSEVITYCQGGYRAANSFVVLKMMGFRRVKMYLGSWGEWGNSTRLPVDV
jgi:thiosulfate/3-mercaptopyruvate sulfurtransferase